MAETANLNVRELGEPGRPALMLLHGFMSCADQWMLNIDALSARYHLLLAELWGHGDSPMPDREDSISISGYLEQFERIRHRHGIKRWGLIGQSYGAGLMLNLALTDPERCSGVVVTNSRSAFGDVTRDKAPRGRADSSSRYEPRALPFHPIHARRFPDEVKAALVAKADAMPEAAVTLGGRVAVGMNCVERLGELESAGVPMLLTNGVFERSFQVDVARLRERYPTLPIADLEGGHSINIEDADGFNQASLAFFEQAGYR